MNSLGKRNRAVLHGSDTLRERLATANRVAVLTGAGISAESGVPTFRSPDGIWAKFKPEELASINAFMANPDMVWQWYQHRLDVVSKAEPNAGHKALADLEAMFTVDVITQNVDGLHQRAGSSHVYELHGSLHRHRCLDCGRTHELEPSTGSAALPSCNHCGGLIRPGVVWFGEMLPEDQWDRSEAAATSADIFMVIGTSAVVYPAAQLPHVARSAGAYIIEINSERTDFTPYADLSLQGKSGEVLPGLVALAREVRKK